MVLSWGHYALVVANALLAKTSFLLFQESIIGNVLLRPIEALVGTMCTLVEVLGMT